MHTGAANSSDFIALIKDQQRLIFKVCSLYAEMPEDRKDIFQEIVLQVWQAYPGFRNASKVSTWMYRIALNTAINYRRKNNKIKTAPLPAFLNEEGINSSFVFDEEYQLMHKLISGLPEVDRAIVMLYLDDCSYKEIADIIGLSESNIGTKLMRIKEKLKTQAHRFINS